MGMNADGQISSDDSAAAELAEALKVQTTAPTISGVYGDTTSAAEGCRSTYDDSVEIFNALKDSIATDAGNIEKAAETYMRADSYAAQHISI